MAKNSAPGNTQKTAKNFKKTTKNGGVSSNSAPAPAGDKRSPHQTRPTAEEEINILERRNLVWDLYRAGASFRQISEHLKSKNIDGSSIGTVHTDLQYLLNLQHTALSLSVEEHIENEIALINDIIFTFYRQMKVPGQTVLQEDKTAAAKLILDCSKERSRLRNLYKPKVLRIETDADFAKALGIAVEDLPVNDDRED